MYRSSYIEIIGLAGSGKSTYLNMLMEEMENIEDRYTFRKPMRFNYLQRIYFLLLFFKFIVIHPYILTWYLSKPKGPYKHCFHIARVTINIKFRVILESLIVKSILKKNSNGLINDEGIIGKVVVLSLLLNKDLTEVIRFLNILLPCQMEIILIDIDSQKAIRQVRERKIPLPFWDQMEEKLRFKLCEDCRERYFNICNLLPEKNGVSVSKFINEGSKADFLEKIKAQYKEDSV